jgi:hypothetical protein
MAPAFLHADWGVDFMEPEDAIKLLKGGEEGIAEWNRRREYREWIPTLEQTNLSDADLSRADLSKVNLNYANLSGACLALANLSDVDLSDANLREADFYAARLTRANFSGANLSRAKFAGGNLVAADLSRARLDGATLSFAELRGANFNDADLGAADFSGAKCGFTIFASVDLSDAEGLDSVRHEFPSTVGIDTLFRSRGRIPGAFLRGCGVPEYLIENQKAIAGSMSPIQFYSCFISYSTKDDEFAKRLHSRMIQKKLRVWYAPDKLQGGREHDVQVDEAIRVYDKLLLVVSEASMKSGWVRREIRRARQQEETDKPRKLFPIRLVSIDAIKAWEPIDPRTGEDFAEELLRIHIPDFSNWKDHDAFEESFARLMRDLRADESTEAKPG